MMPYMVAKTKEVEKVLYFRRWGILFDALAYGFGRNAMFGIASAHLWVAIA
jgi:hypothetical protein